MKKDFSKRQLSQRKDKCKSTPYCTLTQFANRLKLCNNDRLKAHLHYGINNFEFTLRDGPSITKIDTITLAMNVILRVRLHYVTKPCDIGHMTV